MKKVPSLTATGWLTENKERADHLLAYYITSEYSQTQHYPGKITSLPYHVQQFGSNPTRLRDRVESDLAQYFSRYFDSVDIRVNTTLPNEDDPERINLQIDVIVVDQGKRYSLGRLISIQNSKVSEIINLNNG